MEYDEDGVPVFYHPRLPSPPAPLPCVPGPKLAPFTPTAHADIEFIRFIGCEKDKDSVVWKVKINGAGPFALKMFYFCDWLLLLQGNYGEFRRSLASPQLYVDYFDAFNCECRAYGRLKEEQRENLAVRALGYLFLTPQQEIYLAKRMEHGGTPPPGVADDPEPDGGTFWGRQAQHRELPVRAIVKELAPDKYYPDPAQAPRMWADLQALHSLGIFVRDTHGGNYVDGKLVDFSRSWTMYHPALDGLDARQLNRLVRKDLNKLLEYYYEVANYWRDEALIPPDLDALCSGNSDDYKNYPTAYDWLNGAENADEAKAFVKQLFKKAVD
ncbi:hypothetical protein VTH06DRAFT_6891 [Thermothelomyces fergusii]